MQKKNTATFTWDAASQVEVYAHTKRMATKYSRRCTSCGKPTNDYRCPKCWAKLRVENGCYVNGEINEDFMF